MGLQLIAVRSYRRNEYQPPNPRPLLKTYYYIDYQQFIDNVKWRMWRIRKAIDDKLRNVGATVFGGLY